MNIVLLTNILTPYRIFFYKKMHECCQSKGVDFKVVCMAETEPGRHWYYDQFKEDFTILLEGKTKIIHGPYYIVKNKNVLKTLRSLKPDVLIGTGSYLLPTIWKSLVLKKELKGKILFWTESNLLETRNYKKATFVVRDWIRRGVLRRFDGFWYASTLTKKFLQTYVSDLNKKKMFFLPNLVDPSIFSAAREVSDEIKQEIRIKYNVSEGKRLFVCPARLSPVKGILEFLDVLKDCENKDKACVLIAGDGELKDEIERKIKEYGLDVQLLGYKSEKDIVELYSAADCFLLPSMSDPNPLTCIEACWAGLPLLISEHVGNRCEIVKEGKNGQVFAYSNRVETVKAVEEILGADETWYAAAREISVQIANTVYNPDVVVERIVNQMIGYVRT